MIISVALLIVSILISIFDIPLINNVDSSSPDGKYLDFPRRVAVVSLLCFLFGYFRWAPAFNKGKRDSDIEEFNEKKKDTEITSCLINNIITDSETRHPSLKYSFKAPTGVSFRIFRTVGQAPTDFNDMER